MATEQIDPGFIHVIDTSAAVHPRTLTVKAPDGRDLLVIHSDGTVTSDVDDAPEAARVFVDEIRRLLGGSEPIATQPAFDPATDIRHPLLAEHSDSLADRIRAADRRPVAAVPEIFTLSRADVHVLALQLDHDRAVIARLRAELAEATR